MFTYSLLCACKRERERERENQKTNADRGPLSAFSHKALLLAPQYSPMFYVFKLSKHYKNGVSRSPTYFSGHFFAKLAVQFAKTIRTHGQVLRKRVSVESFRSIEIGKMANMCLFLRFRGDFDRRRVTGARHSLF